MQPNKKIVISLLAFQFLIVLGMIAYSMYPLVYGQEIKMKVRPLDPRDLMRGNYVSLNYDFNRLELADMFSEGALPVRLENVVENRLDSNRNYNFGEVVFLELSDNQGFYSTKAVWTKKPANGKIYLKATVDSHYGTYLRLHAGIEDFYTDVKQAKALEKAMRASETRDNTYAVLKVAANGMARLVDVRVE